MVWSWLRSDARSPSPRASAGQGDAAGFTKEEAAVAPLLFRLLRAVAGPKGCSPKNWPLLMRTLRATTARATRPTWNESGAESREGGNAVKWRRNLMRRLGCCTWSMYVFVAVECVDVLCFFLSCVLYLLFMYPGILFVFFQ